MTGAVVYQDYAELVDDEHDERTEVTQLAPRDVEVAVVVHVHKVADDGPPVVQRVVGEHGAGSAGPVDRERAVAVVHYEVLFDVGPTAALDPQIAVTVAVDIPADVAVFRCRSGGLEEGNLVRPLSMLAFDRIGICGPTFDYMEQTVELEKFTEVR